MPICTLPHEADTVHRETFLTGIGTDVLEFCTLPGTTYRRKDRTDSVR